MKNKRSILIGLFFLVMITSITAIVLTGGINLLVVGSIKGFSIEDWIFIRKIITAKNVLENSFYGEFDIDKVYDGAMAGLLSSLDDPYTEYLNRDEDEQLQEIAEGKYEGIGVVVAINPNNGIPTVVGVIEDSPADKADIMPADEIILINGEKTEGLALEESVAKMKVKSGNKLSITLKRSGKEIAKEIVTEEVMLKSVGSENIDGIGYIEIVAFTENTANEFAEKYNELKSQNIKGLILDLRNNGGGVYQEAIKIAQILVPKGLIVYTENKWGEKLEEYSSGEGIKVPLVVLINEESASASEVLAGAIKDRKCGTLIGKRSYGKGVVQGWYKINDGTSIKLTIAKYFTPSGICIDGIGIEPDIEVSYGTYLNDLQMKKAIQTLNK